MSVEELNDGIQKEILHQPKMLDHQEQQIQTEAEILSVEELKIMQIIKMSGMQEVKKSSRRNQVCSLVQSDMTSHNGSKAKEENTLSRMVHTRSKAKLGG